MSYLLQQQLNIVPQGIQDLQLQLPALKHYIASSVLKNTVTIKKKGNKYFNKSVTHQVSDKIIITKEVVSFFHCSYT